MGILLVILALLFFILLVVVTAVRPVRSQYSIPELRRRVKQSKAYGIQLEREALYPALMTFLHVVRAVLLTITIVLFIGGLGWGFGIIVSLVVAVVHPALAKMLPFPRFAKDLYEKSEPKLLGIVAKFKRMLHILSDDTLRISEVSGKVDSVEELSDIIEQSTDVISANERALLASALAFPEKIVNSVMTPRAVIDFIKHSEFLGPLVLDELHALGHSRLPVIGEDLNHVVGVLHLRDLLSLDVKRSTTAEKAMEKKVYYIREDDTLEHALAAFLKTRHHLFIVINKQRETVGLLTLEDVLEALIGRRIVDEDDVHADLRKVAEQEGKSNNSSAASIDV